jgi:hypothetical protein
MADTVRIAMNEPGPLRWPQRCPRCGSTDDLVYLDTRVVRNNRGPQNRLTMLESLARINTIEHVQESFTFSVLMCRRHAQSNQTGGVLLGYGVPMKVLRASIYLGFVGCLLFLWRVFGWEFGIRETFNHLSPGILAFCAWGAIGVAALAWARHVAWVRPLRLDPDYDIAIMRFKDDKYARDFKRMNIRHTTGAAVSTYPIWMRMTPMKGLVLICCVLMLFALWISR